MKTEQFVVVHDEPMKTGECPIWHAVESALYWVDVPGFMVHRLHPASGKYSSWKMDSEPSALASTSTTTWWSRHAMASST